MEKILYFASISCYAVGIVSRTQSQVRQVNWSYIVHGIHDDVLACAPVRPRKVGAEKSALGKRAAPFRAVLIGYNHIKISSNGAK